MVLNFTRPREVAAHTICAANGSQVCGSHYVAISWDWVGVATTWLSVGIGLDTLEQDTTCHTWFIIIIVISNYSIVIGTPCIVRSLN